MTLAEEFASRNFSIYGQWTGVISIVVCFAVGLGNILGLGIFVLPFSILAIIFSFIIIFIEIPLLLRICPMSEGFNIFIRRFETNYMRAAIYAVMSLVMWLSCIVGRTSLIAAAVFLLIAALFYLLAGIKGQGFVGSKTLGGHGVAQMIV